jgi:hypothetical protein
MRRFESDTQIRKKCRASKRIKSNFSVKQVSRHSDADNYPPLH